MPKFNKLVNSFTKQADGSYTFEEGKWKLLIEQCTRGFDAALFRDGELVDRKHIKNGFLIADILNSEKLTTDKLNELWDKYVVTFPEP